MENSNHAKTSSHLTTNRINTKEDEARVQALRRYKIVDTPPEGAFNHIADLAAKLFQVPIALISLVDKERVFFKANVGLPGVKDVARDFAVCSFAIVNDDPTIIPDILEEPCLLSNQTVASVNGLRFYAAAPLTTDDDHNIGTLCILDQEVRHLSQEQENTLVSLAGIVMDELNIRLQAIEALRAQESLMQIAAHDLKSPINNIQTLINAMEGESDKQKVSQITKMIGSSTDKMLELIDRVVQLSRFESEASALDIQPTNFGHLAHEAVLSQQPMAQKKQQKLQLFVASSHVVAIDQRWILEVLSNLVSNAIKYSPKGGIITVYVQAEPHELLFWVSDNGQGFDQEDQQKAFGKFARLSARPTGDESSSGLGLFIVKTLVEMHGGRVAIYSEGKGKGSKITVTIPQPYSV